MTFDQWWQDLRLAWVGLRRAKAFTSAAVLTLAVGIGGTTAMFALIEGVLLRPLPVPQQDRLVVAWNALPSSRAAHWPFRAPDIDVISKESRVWAWGRDYPRNWVGGDLPSDCEHTLRFRGPVRLRARSSGGLERGSCHPRPPDRASHCRGGRSAHQTPFIPGSQRRTSPTPFRGVIMRPTVVR